jgi:ubiquinone/menaquinone biosynthesis C-methylase UbiE
MHGDTWDPGLYEARHAFVWRHGASLVELLAPQPGERFLDLGCGTGHLMARIGEAAAGAVGLDASADMLAQARATYRRRYHPGQEAFWRTCRCLSGSGNVLPCRSL